MKRYFMLAAAALGLVFVAPPSPAADPALESLAARRELEDFVRSTNNRLRDLEESLLAQQKRISTLEDENRRLRGEVAQAHNNTNKDLETTVKRLAEDIKEVDKNRLADNKLIQEKISRFTDEMAASVKSSKPAPAAPKAVIPSGADVFEYKIQSGDNLSKIVPKLKAQGIKVTAEDIQKANPNVVWTKLKIGQSILIPDVK